MFPTLLGLLVCAPAPLQGSAWVVDAALAPGADFADIQAAVDAAGEGDTVLVRQGDYASFAIDGKSLRIVAEKGAAPRVREADLGVFPLGPDGDFTTVVIENLTAGQLVQVRGLAIVPETIVSSQDAPPTLWVRNNAGDVWLEECDVVGNSNEWVFTDSVDRGAPGVVVQSSNLLHLARCSVVGGTPIGWGVATQSPDHGLYADASSVVAYGSSFTGGTANGSNCSALLLPGAPACHGVVLENSTLFAAGSSFRGGDATDGCPGVIGFFGLPGEAGDGLHVADGTSVGRHRDGTFAGGVPAGGLPAGQPIGDAFGGAIEVAGSARSYSVSSPTRGGESATLAVEGEPGDVYFLWFSQGTLGLYIDAFAGVWLPGATGQLPFLGIADDAGRLALTVPVSPLGGGAQAVQFLTQLLSFDGFAIRLEEASALVLVTDAIPPPAGGTACLDDKLEASAPTDHDEFGHGVSLDAGGATPRLLVGVPTDEFFTTETGSAVLYERSGGVWFEGATLEPSWAAVTTFGERVVLDGPRAVVGAPNDDFTTTDDAGTVHVFHENAGGWEQVALLQLFPAQDFDRFGSALALQGDTLAVGLPGRSGAASFSGAVLMYEWDGASWGFDQWLTPGDAAESDHFGGAIALDGDRLLIGAAGKDVGGESTAGTVFAFERVAGSWVEVQTLVASDGAASDVFGTSLALQGDLLLVGASGRDPGGAVYVFEHVAGTWTETDVLEPDVPADAYFFGASLALDGDRCLVGSLSGPGEPGAAWSFERQAGTFVQLEELSDPSGEEWDRFGEVLALDGSLAAIGARQDDGLGENRGSVSVYSLDGSDCP